MFQKRNRFTILFAIGAIILIVGLILSWYPNSVISGMKETLRQGLPQDEQNKYNGALSSWSIWQITVFQPASSLLTVIGAIIMVYAIVSKIFSLASSNNIEKTQGS